MTVLTVTPGAPLTRTLCGGVVALWLALDVALRAAPGVPAPVQAWVTAEGARGTPVLAGGTVYALTRDHEVVAVNAATGAARWRQATERHAAPSRASTLAVAHDVVVSGDEGLTALDRATGRSRWRFSPPPGASAGVYLGGGANGLILAGSALGRVFAVLATSGELAWSTAVAPQPATVFWPVVDDGVVFAGYTTFRGENSGGLVALDARTGLLLWRAAFPASPRSVIGTGWAGGPLVVNGVVIAASGEGRIHGFSRRSGSRLWTIAGVIRGAGAPVPLGDFRALAANGGRLFAGSATGVLTAYDLATLEEVWRYAPSRSSSVGFTLSSHEGTVYVPYGGGSLAAVRAKDGVVRWRLDGPGFLWPPAVSESLVYAASATEGLCAYRR